MLKKNIKNLPPDFYRGKRVFVRDDLNVPQNEDLSISDDSRIRAALDTINFLKDNGARVILCSHLGRPKGGYSEKYSLKPVAKRLTELLGCEVKLLPSCIGPEVEAGVQAMQDGQVVLLENVRFHPEEEKNDPEFSKKLAALADIYVNDAFGTAHRAHASTMGISQSMKTSVSGILLNKEIDTLSQVLDHPLRPFATIIGGAKVSTKIGVLKNLMTKADVIVIGGAMAFSFIKAQGMQVGKSLVEDDRLDLCRELLAEFQKKGVKVILPLDLVCAPELKSGSPASLRPANGIPADQMGLDVGPMTMSVIKNELSKCKSILWNGPLGAFEFTGFETGTYELVDLLVELTAKGVKTVIGGGDSVAALEAHGVSAQSFTHVSTGGGAALEFIEGLELPGVACLDPLEKATV
jgi:phosphoglycerate kinase